MEINNNIEEKVNSTINLLENFEPVEPNPYLYGKIISGIKESSKVFHIFSLRPVLLMILILFNLISAVIFFWFMVLSPELNSDNSVYLSEGLYIDEVTYYEIK